MGGVTAHPWRHQFSGVSRNARVSPLSLPVPAMSGLSHCGFHYGVINASRTWGHAEVVTDYMTTQLWKPEDGWKYRASEPRELRVQRTYRTQATSTYSRMDGSGIGSPSSRIPAICSSTASASNRLTCSNVGPAATQPGRSGKYALYPVRVFTKMAAYRMVCMAISVLPV